MGHVLLRFKGVVLSSVSSAFGSISSLSFSFEKSSFLITMFKKLVLALGQKEINRVSF